MVDCQLIGVRKIDSDKAHGVYLFTLAELLTSNSVGFEVSGVFVDDALVAKCGYTFSDLCQAVLDQKQVMFNYRVVNRFSRLLSFSIV